MASVNQWGFPMQAQQESRWCFRCGQKGHIRPQCKATDAVVSAFRSGRSPSTKRKQDKGKDKGKWKGGKKGGKKGGQGGDHRVQWGTEQRVEYDPRGAVHSR